MPYRQSDTGVGAPAKPSARSVSKAVGNAMAAPCGMRTRYNRPLRRLTRPDVMRAHDSFRPSPGRSPRTSPDSFSRVGPPFCVVPSAEPTCDGSGRSFSIFYRVEDDAVPTVRYSGWRSSEAQRPECVQSGGKCDGRPVRDAYTLQPAAAGPDPMSCGPTVHFDRPPAGAPAPHLIRFPVWARHSVRCRVQSQRAMACGRSFSIFYCVEDDAVPTVRYWCWRSSEAQRPECVQSGGKCDGRPVRDAYTLQPAAA